MNMSDIKFFEARNAVYNPNCSYVRGQNTTLVQKKTNFEKARQIVKTLGLKVAIAYMQKRGYSAECCVDVLLRKGN